MATYEQSITVTTPDGRVVVRIGGTSEHPEGLTDEQRRERVKASIMNDLRWDIQLFRTS